MERRDRKALDDRDFADTCAGVQVEPRPGDARRRTRLGPPSRHRAARGLGMSRVLAGDVKFREVWAWSMYDFANSAYTTVVITAVFGAYFVAAVAGNAVWATFAWTAALSISYAAILITGPIIGAWADAHAAKKTLLLITTVGCVAFTAALALVEPGAVGLALVLVAVSNYFFC